MVDTSCHPRPGQAPNLEPIAGKAKRQTKPRGKLKSV